NNEQALEEHPFNILTSVMHELMCNLHTTVLWVEDCLWSIRNKFLTLWTETIPSWEPETDVTVSLYLHGIANWVCANNCWSFESEQYFGTNGRAVQQNRMVMLMPRQFSMSEPLLIHTLQST
ncbi:hypothetical protein EV421DRAFT_1722345, partial [Armillaria borealis]